MKSRKERKANLISAEKEALRIFSSAIYNREEKDAKDITFQRALLLIPDTGYWKKEDVGHLSILHYLFKQVMKEAVSAGAKKAT